MTQLHGLYQKYNPFRRPDWRWERVLEITQKPNGGRSTKRDDAYVRQARSFYVRWHNREPEDREPLFLENPGLFLAYQMFEMQTADPDHALILQSRLLAGMDYVDIAEAMDTMPQMVEWYEAVFFNVRDKLKKRDWVTRQVLIPAMMRNFGLFDSGNKKKDNDGEQVQEKSWQQQIIARPFMDASLKMFSYFGGPVLCEYMIAGFQQGKFCQSPDGLSEWLDGHWAMTLRARSAQAARTFEVNRYNVMTLFETHARIMEIEKSAESLDQKRSTIERHVGALIGELKDVWAVGDDESSLEGSEVLKYDTGAAELRDDELLVVASGGKVKQDGLEQLTLPPPRKGDGHAG